MEDAFKNFKKEIEISNEDISRKLLKLPGKFKRIIEKNKLLKEEDLKFYALISTLLLISFTNYLNLTFFIIIYFVKDFLIAIVSFNDLRSAMKRSYFIDNKMPVNRKNIMKILYYHSHILKKSAILFYSNLLLLILNSYLIYHIFKSFIIFICYIIFSFIYSALSTHFNEFIYIKTNWPLFKKITGDKLIEKYIGEKLKFSLYKSKRLVDNYNKFSLCFLPFLPFIVIFLFLTSIFFLGYYRFDILNLNFKYPNNEYSYFIFCSFLITVVFSILSKILWLFLPEHRPAFFTSLFIRNSSFESELLFKRTILPIFGSLGRIEIFTNKSYNIVPIDEAEFREGFLSLISKGFIKQEKSELPEKKIDGYFSLTNEFTNNKIFIAYDFGIGIPILIPNLGYISSLSKRVWSYTTSDERWKKVFATRLDRTDFCVFYLNEFSDNLFWEVEKVSKTLPKNRIIILFKKNRMDVFNKFNLRLKDLDLNEYKCFTFNNTYFGRSLLLINLNIYMLMLKL